MSSLLFHPLPLTFPYRHHVVALVFQELQFLHRALVHIIGTPIIKAFMTLGSVGVTFGAAMPEISLELVDGVGLRVVPVYGVAAVGDTVFSLVGCVPNTNPYRLGMQIS